MPYYIRVLAEKNDLISINEIRKYLSDDEIDGEIVIYEGNEDSWTQILLKDSLGNEVALVEKNEVTPGSIAQQELDEFSMEVIDYKPKSAANWLCDYFPKVKVIYAFHVLNPAYQGDGWDVIGSVHSGIQYRLDGIFQADNEGFSNKNRCHILWQFDDDVDGPWYMAVLDENKEWIEFEIELSNHYQRNAFLHGSVPFDVELLEGVCKN